STPHIPAASACVHGIGEGITRALGYRHPGIAPKFSSQQRRIGKRSAFRATTGSQKAREEFLDERGCLFQFQRRRNSIDSWCSQTFDKRGTLLSKVCISVNNGINLPL